MIAPPDSATKDPRIVLIDDDPLIHALVGAMLKPLGARVAFAHSGEEGISQARAERTDAILLDNEMPGASGLEVLARLKQDQGLASLPVIMQTGAESKETLAACFAAGAVDYIRKPFTAVELRARVGSVLERQRMMLELRKAAQTDKLTGLANRALLSVRLSEALARVQCDERYKFTLLFLDFDRFKAINDSLGHEVGDMLLQSIAERLEANLRVTDTIIHDTGTTIARLGGDEFVVILEDINTPDLVGAVADRLLTALGAPYRLGGHTVSSTASIGMVYSSQEYTVAEHMLRDADIAMYEAKARGRARHVAFTSSMRDAARNRHELENDLRRAIGTSQLHVAYLPVVSLEDHSIGGVEALARWTHPTRGDVPPAEFIQLAEETRLILPLSDWILRESCEAFAGWKQALGDRAPQYISVNLSRIQLADPQLVERTLRIAAEAGVEPQQLQLEVTESQIMMSRGVALGLLAEFRKRGVRIAMDDFGTGNSSLSGLQEFPLDVLKVDRKFVASSGRGHHFAALLHAVVTLAENLGLQVVAEGIETEEQLALLQTLGCPFGQGYLLGRPMPALEIIALLNARVEVGS